MKRISAPFIALLLFLAALPALAQDFVPNGTGGSGSSGGGTVTSVGLTATGMGLIGVSPGTPITGSGAFNLSVSGNSGGIPYFNSATSWASSPLLPANQLMIGGGAGNPPSTVAPGLNVLTALGNAINATSGLPNIVGTIIPGDCLTWGPGIQDAGGICTTGGAVSSVGNAAADTSLTLTGSGAGPFTGAITAKINLSNAQTWSNQTFVAPSLGAALATSLAINGAALPTNARLALNYSPGANIFTPGLSVINANPATAGNQQPACYGLSGQGWATTALTSDPVAWQICDLAIQNTVPSSTLNFMSSINGGAYTTPYTMGSGGTMNALTGFTVAGAGTTVGNGLVQVTATGNFNWATRSLISSPASQSIQFGNNAQTIVENLSVPISNTLQLGLLDAAAAVPQILGVQNVVAGTSNAAGALRTETDSGGTGTGVSGGFAWQTHPAGLTGTAQNPAVTKMALSSPGDLTLGQYVSCTALTTNASGQLLCNGVVP